MNTSDTTLRRLQRMRLSLNLSDWLSAHPIERDTISRLGTELEATLTQTLSRDGQIASCEDVTYAHSTRNMIFTYHLTGVLISRSSGVRYMIRLFRRLYSMRIADVSIWIFYQVRFSAYINLTPLERSTISRIAQLQKLQRTRSLMLSYTLSWMLNSSRTLTPKALIKYATLRTSLYSPPVPWSELGLGLTDPNLNAG